MKVIDLLTPLSQTPSGADIVVKGYEGGVDDIVDVKLVNIKKDVNAEWYYGKHEIDDNGGIQAVFIQREERQAD